MTIANEGDTEETDVEIAVAVVAAMSRSRGGGAFPDRAGRVPDGNNPARACPATGSAVTIEVTLGTRLGEEDTADNEFSYEVTFE